MAVRKYAEDTKAPVMQTKNEIEKLLKKHDATGIGMVEFNATFSVAFQMNGRNILFRMPDGENEQQRRAQWRCLLLTIKSKSKIESARSGIERFEEAFLAQTVMPNGQTVYEVTQPTIADHYAGDSTVPLLPHFAEGSE